MLEAKITPQLFSEKNKLTSIEGEIVEKIFGWRRGGSGVRDLDAIRGLLNDLEGMVKSKDIELVNGTIDMEDGLPPVPYVVDEDYYQESISGKHDSGAIGSEEELSQTAEGNSTVLDSDNISPSTVDVDEDLG